MDAETEAMIREELQLKRRALHNLKLQLARVGLYADPYLIIQAEDHEAEVRRLEAQLGITHPMVASVAPPRVERRAVPEPVFRQRVEESHRAARQSDIEHQMTMLRIHRGNLAHYRTQAKAFGGVEYAMPITRNGMAEARAGIQAAKRALEQLGSPAEDLPGDE